MNKGSIVSEERTEKLALNYYNYVYIMEYTVRGFVETRNSIKGEVGK